MIDYSEFVVELVALVVEIVDGDGDQVLAAVVVAPVDCAGREGDDVTAADAVHLLVQVSLFPLLRGWLFAAAGLVCLGAAREDDADESLTCT